MKFVAVIVLGLSAMGFVGAMPEITRDLAAKAGPAPVVIVRRLRIPVGLLILGLCLASQAMRNNATPAEVIDETPENPST